MNFKVQELETERAYGEPISPYSFIHSTNVSWSTYYMPGTMLSTGK